MVKRILVIDRDDLGRFFVSVDGTTLTIGNSPTQVEAVLRNLHISRIQCEVEVKDPLVVVGTPEQTSGGKELHAGQSIQVGHTRVRMKPAEGKAEASGLPKYEEAPRLVEMPVVLGPLAKQLRVVDGADQGRAFRLPEAGVISIGKSGKHADFVLHDLYVSRVHCEVEVEGDKVLITHQEGPAGTLIAGRRITDKQELRIGEILRIGNSHLRLEPATDDAEPPGGEDENEPAVLVQEDSSTEDTVDEEMPQAQTPDDPILQLEGQILGHFRIGQLLGRGHSGVVFRAQNLKNNLVVAIKVLAPDFPASGEELQRFVQALKVATGLHHANLVTLYGAGRTGSYCWIAREYVEGLSLHAASRRLKEAGKSTWGRAIRLAVHLTRALAYLHENKTLHGNIVPHNILIRNSDKAAILADLMLTKALEGSRLEAAIVEKKLLAELPYLAPEQTEPSAFVDHLADLYALGAVVYHLLTFQPPFSGESPEQLIEQIRQTAPVRPSKYQRGIPPAFEAIVLKLMAKHQEDRYQSAKQLLAEVEAIALENEIEV